MKKLDWTIWGAVLVVAAIFGAGFFYARHSLRTQKGQRKASFVFHDAAGQKWNVNVDRVAVGRGGGRTASGYRVMTFDFNGDEPLATHVFDDRIECWVAKGTRLWCAEPGEVTLLKIPSLSVEAQASALLQQAARPAMVAESAVRADKDVVVSSGGKRVRIDGETLAIGEVP